MKTNLVRMAVLAVVAVTMAAPAFAGQMQSVRAITPDPNDWQYREALETGNLPSNAVDLKSASGAAADVPTVQYGSTVYRVGIDTP